MIQTLNGPDQGVRFIDQTKLPTEETTSPARLMHRLPMSSRNMVVRGAPPLAWPHHGIALGVRDSKAETVGDLSAISTYLRQHEQNPAYGSHLFWASADAEKFERLRVRPIAQISRKLVENPTQHAEDIALTSHGTPRRTLMPAEGGVLTHCNAGAGHGRLRHGAGRDSRRR